MNTIDKEKDIVGITLFNRYLSKHQEKAKSTKINDYYYHVDVVAEAYNQGLSDGKNIGKNDYIDKLMKINAEKFAERANQVYILTKAVLSHIIDNGYSVRAFYINIYESIPKVIMSVDNDVLLDDKFVELAYTKVFDVKSTFTLLYNKTLDISFVGNKYLEVELLRQDGFDYSENI